MKANRVIPISGHVDKETKEWMENHLFSASAPVNYYLYRVRMMKKNKSEAKTHVTSVSIKPRAKEQLPF